MTDPAAPDFDRIIDRRNTNSTKWDKYPPGYEQGEFVPMWVADMDFQAPEPVIEALREVVNRGVFGYSMVPEGLTEAYIRWVKKRQGAELSEEWLLQSGSVLKSLAVAIRSLTARGDGIILQSPVYHPFAPLIRANGRKVVENPLVETAGRYTLDLDHLNHVAKEARALLFCNPHNPVGRVFTRDELTALLDICSRHRLLVISDEIHSDIIMPGNAHIPLYSLCEEYDVPVAVLTSTTKTFNIAGMQMGWITAPDAGIRGKLEETLRAAHDGRFDYFAAVAAFAAYGKSEYWLDALLRYLDGNRAVLEREMEKIPGINVSPLEGTYLAWLDFRNTRVHPEVLKDFMLKKTGVWLNAGEIFGHGGAGFQRMNLATPRGRLLEACGRIQKAFS